MLRTDERTDRRTDGQTDGRSGPTTRPAFAKATQVITFMIHKKAPHWNGQKTIILEGLNWFHCAQTSPLVPPYLIRILKGEKAKIRTK